MTHLEYWYSGILWKNRDKFSLCSNIVSGLDRGFLLCSNIVSGLDGGSLEPHIEKIISLVKTPRSLFLSRLSRPRFGNNERISKLYTCPKICDISCKHDGKGN